MEISSSMTTTTAPGANFGKTISANNSTAAGALVPEPLSCQLIVLGVAALIRYRSRVTGPEGTAGSSPEFFTLDKHVPNID